ncbi:secreted RxLR effector protein 161-like [Pistacia vera]|uniref:secreted RxLR effector protein 161-like n=1 Tax=Pistacia vera TaxID=55513 RepID=UPI0012639B22|nr:secreted RxLR effector protein 161-like [Pistacia vera]
MGIILCKNKEEQHCIRGFVDADYAHTGDIDKRKSTSSFVFTLWGNVISWKSKLQHLVTLSSTEFEYVALTEATKEAIWLKGFVNELELEQKNVEIKSDSQSAIHLSKN